MVPDVVLTCLDLFSGRKTASQPFFDRGWTVIPVDIDPTYRPMYIADLTAWTPPFPPRHFDFIWASPPCQVFSNASGGRHFKRENWHRRRWYPGKNSGHDVAGVGHVDRSELGPRPGSGQPWTGLAGSATAETKLRRGNYPYKRSRIVHGNLYPITTAGIEGVKLVERTLALIDYLDPLFFAMENPTSLLRSIIGPPTIITDYCTWGHPFKKPTDLWCDLPAMDWNSRLCNGQHRAHRSITRDLEDPIERAEVPYELGWSIAEAIELYLLDGSLLPDPVKTGGT